MGGRGRSSGGGGGQNAQNAQNAQANSAQASNVQQVDVSMVQNADMQRLISQIPDIEVMDTQDALDLVDYLSTQRWHAINDNRYTSLVETFVQSGDTENLQNALENANDGQSFHAYRVLVSNSGSAIYQSQNWMKNRDGTWQVSTNDDMSIGDTFITNGSMGRSGFSSSDVASMLVGREMIEG